jgi:hypothetical protein
MGMLGKTMQVRVTGVYAEGRLDVRRVGTVRRLREAMLAGRRRFFPLCKHGSPWQIPGG